MGILPEKLPDSIDHAVENLTEPVTANAGNTFGDLWFLVFGGISQAAAKRRIKYAVEAEKFRKDTEERILGIPGDDLKEPNTQIATQALEHSKYCIEEEPLRKMFSELIASSMMKSREGVVHPSFAMLLSQLSSSDALALLRFKNNSSLPIISVISKNQKSGGHFLLLFNEWVRSLATELTEKFKNASREVSMEKGYIKLTQYGHNFISCVLPR